MNEIKLNEIKSQAGRCGGNSKCINSLFQTRDLQGCIYKEQQSILQMKYYNQMKETIIKYLKRT